MFGLASGILLTAGLLVQESLTDADEIILPAPQRVQAAPVVVPAIYFLRPNPYDVWQAYAVDSYGRFRPRVIPAPDGFRYVANGASYSPWPNYPQKVSPMIVQQAVFDQGGPPPLIVLPRPGP